ncbi:MAG: ribonuclease HII [Candidatus Pacebacteria bacterium]|nr:ribonuclease HII [Candidatus Paceibacterota bacterium]
MNFILGVDEAGRGPLAGPLSIGVVSVPEDIDLLALFPTLNDSKQLTEKKREKIFNELEAIKEEQGIRYVVLYEEADAIDELGLTEVVRRSVWKGVEELLPVTSEGKVYLDGLLSAPPGYTQETVVGGDGLIPSIMLASIVAKVSRDRLMCEYAKSYPEYGFEKHKGYGTKAHYEAIEKNGLTPLHRRRFLKGL